MREVTVFSRQRCHLCELLLEEIEPLCRAHGVALSVVDVDMDANRRERYGPRVPVVCAGDVELCCGHFDRARVVAWLREEAP
jgi:thioredoxin reductase (NADPH)